MSHFRQRNHVKIEIRGAEILRFLNLCKNIGVDLANIEWIEEGTVQAELSFADFFRIKGIRKKTRVRIRILKKKGIRIFYKRVLLQKYFLAGALGCLLLLWSYFGRLWEIQIQGNLKNTDMQILEALNEKGIVHGMRTKEISCAKITEFLRGKYENIAWVSAKIKGVCLLLEIQETIAPVNIEVRDYASSLTAPFDGTIVSMITKAGTPVKKVGELCEKGELLVLGEVPLYNDSQEKTGLVEVYADADILLERKEYYYDSFPMIYEKNGVEEFLQNQYFLIFHKKWFLGFQGGKEQTLEYLTEMKEIKLTESLHFPVVLGTISSWRVKKQKCKYTKKEATALAKQRLSKYQEKLLEKGVQISGNNVKIEINYAKCTVQGDLVVIESKMNRVPNALIQNIERTSKDG